MVFLDNYRFYRSQVDAVFNCYKEDISVFDLKNIKVKDYESIKNIHLTFY